MKALVFIVSIYFLFLALLPCSCNLQIVDSFSNETEQISSAHAESNFLDDDCTPFCACSSIHNPNFIAKHDFNFQNTCIDTVKKNAIYNENRTSSYLESLWRPPKA
ncbi:hypothetical protein [uncultured Bacteroides sp.]|uniref:hypothetical protein n=1 Tax=uncultured Bacteroides sp. TaxID=162156 RepID=UPI002AA6FF60|nr:hypothetical protein [uncultured Bacteroides sp.]